METTETQDTKAELMKKFDVLVKLKKIEDKGIKLSQNFSLKSDYNEMLYEYEVHAAKLKKNEHENQKRIVEDLLKYFLNNFK